MDKATGKSAAARLAQVFGTGKVVFVRTDVGDGRSVKRLKSAALRAFGKVDIVVNNATITPMGAVLAKGYEKDPHKLAENLRVVQGWQDTVEGLAALLQSGSSASRIRR